jgi:hypothetical protein
MKYTSRAPVAMVLPVPYAPVENGENGGAPLRFVDFSEYPDFFSKLASGFVVTGAGPGTLGSELGDDEDAPLAVERVGSFVASFVPRVADFARLDKRFRMSDDVWRALPQYRDWGFAVFQLDAGDRGEVHPMSFLFRTREPGRVFFPTVHVHDGTVPQRAHFDHMLYAQTSAVPRDWQRSYKLASTFVDVDRTQRLVRASAEMHRLGMYGARANEDVWLDA